LLKKPKYRRNVHSLLLNNNYLYINTYVNLARLRPISSLFIALQTPSFFLKLFSDCLNLLSVSSSSYSNWLFFFIFQEGFCKTEVLKRYLFSCHNGDRNEFSDIYVRGCEDRKVKGAKQVGDYACFRNLIFRREGEIPGPCNDPIWIRTSSLRSLTCTLINVCNFREDAGNIRVSVKAQLVSQLVAKSSVSKIRFLIKQVIQICSHSRSISK